jgi:hypothetical protein
MEDLAKLLSDFQKMQGDVTSFIKNDLPRICGVEGKRIVKQNFLLHGYDNGISFTKWPKRDPKTDAAYDRGKTVNARTGKLSKYRTGKNSTFKGSVYSSANPLLMQSHALYDAIDYRVINMGAFIGVNLNIVPYAEVHNVGLHHEPLRQYMPRPTDRNANPKIMNAIYHKAKYEIENRMKKFAQ